MGGTWEERVLTLHDAKALHEAAEERGQIATRPYLIGVAKVVQNDLPENDQVELELARAPPHCDGVGPERR